MPKGEDLQNKTAVHPPKLPKWTRPLFVIAMTLCICAVFFKFNWILGAFEYRYLSIHANAEADGFYTVDFDTLRIIPYLNRIPLGNLFSDPWNSYNFDYKGMGIGSPVAELIGGALIYLSSNYFAAMSIWGLFNWQYKCREPAL